MLTTNEIFQQLVRTNWNKSQIAPGGKWQTYAIIVAVNLAESKAQPDRWQTMKLL